MTQSRVFTIIQSEWNVRIERLPSFVFHEKNVIYSALIIRFNFATPIYFHNSTYCGRFKLLNLLQRAYVEHCKTHYNYTMYAFRASIPLFLFWYFFLLLVLFYFFFKHTSQCLLCWANLFISPIYPLLARKMMEFHRGGEKTTKRTHKRNQIKNKTSKLNNKTMFTPEKHMHAFLLAFFSSFLNREKIKLNKKIFEEIKSKRERKMAQIQLINAYNPIIALLKLH